MRLRSPVHLALGLALFAPFTALADSEAPNRPYVTSEKFGRCFAHSVPAAMYGTEGVTDVYSVTATLEKIDSFPWYSQTIYVACDVREDRGISAPALVRFGPWARGQFPNDNDLAIAFYFNGKEVSWRSTLDIADGDRKNSTCTVSHYSVIQEVKGFSYDQKNFIVITSDGRELTFDVRDGRIIKAVKSADSSERLGNCPTLEELKGVTP